MKPFDIVLTCNYSPWSRYRGGGQKSVHMLACAFARAGRRVCVVYSKAPWEKVPVPGGLPYAVRWAFFFGIRPGVSSPLRFLNGLAFLGTVRRLAGPGTLVIGNGDEASLLRRAHPRGRFLFASRNTWDTRLRGADWTRPSGWARAFFREPRDVAAALAARTADRVVCSSIHSLVLTRGCFRVPPAKGAVIPNGIDAVFTESAFEEKGQRGVLFFGRLAGNKGAAHALEAWLRLPEAVRREHPLTFAGEGPLKAGLERRAAAAGESGRVRFAGWLESRALARAIVDHRLVALPSLEESFGNAIAETLATGQHLVTTTACSIPEVAGPYGVMVPPGDVPALSEAMGRELARIRSRSEIADQRRYFRERFSWDQVASAYLGMADGRPVRLAPAREPAIPA